MNPVILMKSRTFRFFETLVITEQLYKWRCRKWRKVRMCLTVWHSPEDVYMNRFQKLPRGIFVICFFLLDRYWCWKRKIKIAITFPNTWAFWEIEVSLTVVFTVLGAGLSKKKYIDMSLGFLFPWFTSFVSQFSCSLLQ